MRHESRGFGKAVLGGASNGSYSVLLEDDSGNALLARGATIPSAAAGYAVGGQFIKTGARPGLYVNTGTVASSAFLPSGQVGGQSGYAIVDGGTTATAGGDATETITLKNPASAADLAFAGYSTTDDADEWVSQIVTNTTTLTTVATADPSTAHAADWFTVRQGANPVYEVFAAGNFTTAGGDATESITVTGALATDLVLVQLKTKGASPVTLAAADAAADAITVTMSGDPSTDHVLSYMVLRLAGSFTPSHYIVAAGTFTTVGGDATESITVATVAATDVAFAVIRVTNDTDKLVTVAAAAGAITVVQSADPLTAHAYSYMALRAFA